MEYTYENPSPEYKVALELGKQFQRDRKVFTGKHSYQSYAILRQLCETYGSRDILDYGSGKNFHLEATNIRLLVNKENDVKQIFPSWKEALGVQEIFPYDPCVVGHDVLPDRKFDGVMSVDVLQYICSEDLPWVLDKIFSLANQWVYAVFPLYDGKKQLADGSRAHKSICSLEWWLDLWVQTAEKYPDLTWETRVEIAQPPISHRRFAGKGKNWEEKVGWWRVFKPDQLETLTKKQQEELIMLAQVQKSPMNPQIFRKKH